MTTIAWDGRVLAADGRITEGSHIFSEEFIKIQPPVNKRLMFAGQKVIAYGIAGNFDLMADFEHWLEKDCEHDIFTGGDINSDCILILQKCVMLCDSVSGGRFAMLAGKIAIGSGGMYARSAMKMGLNAVEAVDHAKLFDCYSGGITRSVVCRK